MSAKIKRMKFENGMLSSEWQKKKTISMVEGTKRGADIKSNL